MTKKLKKKDANGRWRFWWGEVVGQVYYTYSQMYGGSVRRSAATHPRQNSLRTLHQQAEFELQALYAKRERLGWSPEHPRQERTPRPSNRFFQPMLAFKYPQRTLALPFDIQPKLDGVRCIASESGLWSRKNTALTSVPHIQEAMGRLLASNPDVAYFDGELYLHGWPLPKISGLARLKRPSEDSLKLEYHIFDIVPNFGSLPWAERKKRLQRLKGLADCIKIVRTDTAEDQDDVDFLHQRYVRLGYEGTMHRVLMSPYIHKRSSSLLKRKDFHDEEAKIVKVEEGNGSWRGAVKSVSLVDSRGIGFSAGVRGELGDLRRAWSERAKLIGQTCTFRYLYRDQRSGRPQLPVVINLHRWDK